MAVPNASAPPGWYPDPEVAGQRRYWDGDRWTDQKAAVAPSPAPTPREAIPPLVYVASCIALCFILGAFLPWLQATAPFYGTVSRSGVDGGGDGLFFLGFAAVIGWVVYDLAHSRRITTRSCVVLLVLGALAGSLTGFEFADIRHRFQLVHNATELIATTYGAGLYILAMTSVAAAAAGALGLRVRRRRPAVGLSMPEHDDTSSSVTP